MTIFFQIAAVVAIVFASVFMLRGGGARHQAIRRLLLLLFIVVAGFSIFFPQLWTSMAGLFGIGRGADLLLYVLVLAFLGYVAASYRRNRQLESNVTQLAQKVALLSVQHPEVKADDDSSAGA